MSFRRLVAPKTSPCYLKALPTPYPAMRSSTRHPYHFCYPPATKLLAMQKSPINRGSEEGRSSIKTALSIAMFDYPERGHFKKESQLHRTSAPDRIALHGSSSQRHLARPEAGSGTARRAGSAGHWPGKKHMAPRWQAGSWASQTLLALALALHPPASSNGSMPGRSVKVT